MTARLQMRLGVVAEQDRLSDSQDTTVVVEPTVGSVARSKGSLYLLVTGPAHPPRVRDATRLVAEAIRDEYFYDESAGIQVILTKVIRSANRRLAAQRERVGLGRATDEPGPIGLGLAVVRGSELYVVTVGRVAAYMVRQDRLLTLPDPHGETGLPTKDIAPQVWKGDVGVGDIVALISANVVGRVGVDEIRDGLVSLHPSSAVEHIHHRFVAMDGTGSDGAIALEAAEVASTYHRAELVPVAPEEPLAGSPERSPIPLADSLSGGVAAVTDTASRARRAAGGAARDGLDRVQDLLPRRAEPSRKVTPVTARRATQRRVAIAALVLIGTIAVVGVGVFAMGGGGTSPGVVAEVTAGQQALESAQESLRLVYDNGSNLVTDDPTKAMQLLTNAYEDLKKAAAADIPPSTITPLQRRVVAGLDDLYGVAEVAATQAFSFDRADPAVSLARIVQGPDGAPYVLDGEGHAVYRVDLAGKKASLILAAGAEVGKTKAGEPRFLSVSGPDLLILDSKNILWRFRPDRQEGQRDARPRDRRGLDVLGQGHPRDGDLPPRPGPGPVQPLHRGPFGAADPPLLARRGRERLPGCRHRLPRRAPGRLRDLEPVHRRRAVGRGRDGDRPIQRGSADQEPRGGPRRRAPAAHPGVRSRDRVWERAGRPGVRLGRPEPPHRGHGQGDGRVRGAVPAGT